MLQAIGLVAGLGMSLWNANDSKKAANQNSEAANLNVLASMDAMKEQAAVDGAQRRATANAMIADVRSKDAQVEQLQRAADIMGMQGKADAVIRAEGYNKLASMQMVMGAASGRVMDGYGSMGAIVDKSYEDFQWDQMWNENSVTINQAALYQDMQSIRQAQSTSLLLGKEQIDISRMASQAGLNNAARTGELQSRQSNIAIQDSNRALTSSLIKNIGVGGISSAFGGLGSSNKTLIPMGNLKSNNMY